MSAFTIWLPDSGYTELQKYGDESRHFARVNWMERVHGAGRGENYTLTFYKDEYRWGAGWMMLGHMKEYQCSPMSKSNEFVRVTAQLARTMFGSEPIPA